ncbi:UNKNOWN [Stylonychia lemnae]|uniref:Uncharacterized protein n=1 Tax=Stylonychia lemnae TaxID=5949 RepID=A0A078ARN6_STYLE|nr:UNKNOWN [Stylonychia lemnae]|eukprot:CDW84864.1 UNKNOWN [Stylonychia lemnae]
MDDKPYQFDPQNPRLVTNAEIPQTQYYLAGALFLLSVRAYHRRVFRVDQNTLNLVLFSGASSLASYAWANFFLSSGVLEAGQLNNQKELQRA